MSQVLRQLLELVPQEFVNRRDQYGWFPFHRLANGKDRHNVRPGMIRQLCVARAEVDVEKQRGFTPLMYAVNTGFIAAADELMLQGADIYKMNDEGTTIYDAAWHRTTMREWCRRLGVGAGAGVSGKGRLQTCQPNRLAPKIQQKIGTIFLVQCFTTFFSGGDQIVGPMSGPFVLVHLLDHSLGLLFFG